MSEQNIENVEGDVNVEAPSGVDADAPPAGDHEAQFNQSEGSDDKADLDGEDAQQDTGAYTGDDD